MSQGEPVDLSHISRRYRTGFDQLVTALENVTLSIAGGSVVGVTGPSGSGKSTLLHIIGAMDAPDSGSALVGDVDVTSLTESAQADYRSTIGFVFQRFHLLPALNVIDNVVAPILPYKVAFDKYEKARELLTEVGLANRERDLPARLSGGQQQRVAIARALVNSPGLLLADEPTGNLDSSTGKDIMELLLRFRDERAMTIIVATHDPLIAGGCDRIVRLEDGRVVNDADLSDETRASAVLDDVSRWQRRGSPQSL